MQVCKFILFVDLYKPLKAILSFETSNNLVSFLYFYLKSPRNGNVKRLL